MHFVATCYPAHGCDTDQPTSGRGVDAALVSNLFGLLILLFACLLNLFTGFLFL